MKNVKKERKKAYITKKIRKIQTKIHKVLHKQYFSIFTEKR